MSRPCPNCGTACAMEARFCRLCGTPLKPAVTGGELVSPGAKTAPLTDEGRTTHGLSTEDGSASAAETARVRRAEMESILRRHVPAPAASPPAAPPLQREANSEAFADETTVAAPITTALATGADGSSSSRSASEDSYAAQAARASNGSQAEGGAKADGADVKEGRASGPSAAGRRMARPRGVLKLAGLALVGLAVGAGAIILYYSRSSVANDSSSSNSASAPASTSDPKRLMEERLSEAEALLAEGKVSEAISRLRQAIRVEPSSARAHRLLAEALERTGAVNEAIDEYRVAAQLDPANEEIQLRYADALRRVGRTDEAREIYQRLSASSSAEVARGAKEQLGGMPAQTASNNAQGTQADGAEESAGSANTGAPPAASSSSTSAPPASANTGSSASRSKNDAAASYATAMKIIEGKDIRKMNRAELIRAYELFQYAQTGPNSADANRRLRELDKELFERRKRKQ